MSAVDPTLEQETFWANHEKQHQCLYCGSWEETLIDGYCVECDAKRRVRFPCLLCGELKSFEDLAPNAIYCKPCQAAIDARDAAMEEDIAYFDDLLEEIKEGRKCQSST